jgi:hypothetical protein
MTLSGRRSQPSGTRRYLVHLFLTRGENPEDRHYGLRIQLWTPRGASRAPSRERLFEDEYELIRAVNPILPHGSDVRHVLNDIEGPEGFLYLLHLSSEQAAALGWWD